MPSRLSYLSESVGNGSLCELRPARLEPFGNGKGRYARCLAALGERITNAIFFHVLKSGCAWRPLPHGFPTTGRPSTTSSRPRKAPGRTC
jgi:transposase